MRIDRGEQRFLSLMLPERGRRWQSLKTEMAVRPDGAALPATPCRETAPARPELSRVLKPSSPGERCVCICSRTLAPSNTNRVNPLRHRSVGEPRRPAHPALRISAALCRLGAGTAMASHPTPRHNTNRCQTLVTLRVTRDILDNGSAGVKQRAAATDGNTEL
ncbi:hypothetical protein COCON_G00199800 [Conger conger]|uniref:Uncharacterized protein n=1 Tax=Conger conger TaxID=82655 RepID=A0A9Q1D1J5_CONCO|nr:hypothetical protein COCON_G00199800 [Conger conger]